MELTFKPHRLAAIRRLRDITHKDIGTKMCELSGAKRIDIGRWESDHCTPNSFEKVNLLALATDVPVGFYYYNRVDITLKENWVEIFIPDTSEQIRFPFIPIV